MSWRRAISLSALAGLVLAACAPTPDADPDAGARRFLSIGTAPPGGAFFVVGGALSEVLQAHRGPINWLVTAEATKGSQENIRRLVTSELDFALANAAISYFAVRGAGDWQRPQEIRAVMTLAPNVAMFLTPEDSDVREIGDLRGRRVVVGPAGAGFEYFVGPILEAHGLDFEDFTPLYNTQAAAVEMLADGSAAAAFLGGAVPTASITQATAGQRIRFVPFAEEAIEELVGRYPFFDRVAVPAGTYRGQSEIFQGLNVGSMHLITGASQDEELVFQVIRTIWEHRAEVAEKHAAGKAIQPQRVVHDTGVPFHPGAVRYYRKIGIWPAPAIADPPPG